MSIEEQRRERFEQWAAEKLGWGDDDLRRDRNGDYFWLEARERLDTWNAALDGAVIDLSTLRITSRPGFTGSERVYVSDLTEICEAAGLKVIL